MAFSTILFSAGSLSFCLTFKIALLGLIISDTDRTIITNADPGGITKFKDFYQVGKKKKKGSQAGLKGGLDNGGEQDK